MTVDPIAAAPKALRLAQYLQEFVRLRRAAVRDVETYEEVLWFTDIPQQPECRSPAWTTDLDPDDPWLIVEKQEFVKPPPPPESVAAWIDEVALTRATADIPALRSVILVPDDKADISEGEEPPLREEPLERHPEIIDAYDRYRPLWLAWAGEQLRREAIHKIYARLFNIRTQLRKQGEIVELVLGLGLLDWRHPGAGAAVRRPVVIAHIDLHFDPHTGCLRITAAADGARPRLEDDMLEPEIRPERGLCEAVSAQLAEIGDDLWDRPRVFAALKSWGHALHPDTVWSEGLDPVADGADKPCVSFAPALILRRRTEAGMTRVYQAMLSQLGGDGTAPPRGWAALTEDLDDRAEDETVEPTAENGRPWPGDGGEPFFPLPANREQRRIVEALRGRRGVLVQGPPGTGKSHTIANLVCHLLATGQRVLITAETGRALRVVKEKLPAELQPLCVSLLGQGGDAFAELNAAVQGITARQAVYRPGLYDEEIAEIDRDLDRARRDVRTIEGEIRSFRQDETIIHTLGNGAYQGTASRIARRVAEERARFGWLSLPYEAPAEAPFVRDDLQSWLAILRRHDPESIAGAGLRTVESHLLPSPAEFSAGVAAEREAAQAAAEAGEPRRHPACLPLRALPANARAALADGLRDLGERWRHLMPRGDAWIKTALAEMARGQQAVWLTRRDRSQALLARARALHESLGSRAVEIRPGRDPRRVRSDAARTRDHLMAGGKWSRFGLFTAKAIKECLYLRDEVTVDGQPADAPERLQTVCDHLDLAFAFGEIERLWEDCGTPPTVADPALRIAAIAEQVELLDETIAFADARRRQAEVLRRGAPPVPEPDWDGIGIATLLDVLRAVALEEDHRAATARATASLSQLEAVRDRHDAHPVVAALRRAVLERDASAYGAAYDALVAIENTRRDQAARARLEQELEQAIPGLVAVVTADRGNRAWDDRLADWGAAWRWAAADNWLRKRTDFTYHQRLSGRLNKTGEAIATLLARAAALRAWARFFERLTPEEASALKAWVATEKAIGKGTGRSARVERLRREARQYMDRCRRAVPVWIMPRYLVAEMVDPAPGRYDVVIVDEASQLGIESLFLFYLAKKVVVVGDDQQISPYGIGLSDDAVAALQRQYLEGMPHKIALNAQSSLYTNAQIRFGQSIVLREHFRCMPEIIQFSNDLCYAPNGTPLDPLRAYAPDRLEPLVVRHVADGYRSGSAQNAQNEPEAEAIIAQIKTCLADPRYAQASFGVISLQGDAQARLIERKLLGELEPEVIEERRLICGDAYAFQGDERHVIFLSLVAAPGEHRIGALADEAARRRFSVAASRAQDQLWLFYSAGLDILSPHCVRRRLLSYMLNPGRAPTEESVQKFDSEFERAVYQRITAKGLHVRTQVAVGDPVNHRYRIDLVVEGMRGRLAVECDGEHWHGPERYEQDMARQRDLERAGWRFARIRGGEFYRDPDRALAPLWAELDRLGIRPGGIDRAASSPAAAAGSQDKMAGAGIADGSAAPAAGAPDAQPETAAENPSRANSHAVLPYTAYGGPGGPDPRSAGADAVAEILCRIIAAEGPILTRRVYDIYLRAGGIARLKGALKRGLDRGLDQAIRQGRIVAASESRDGDPLSGVLRLPGSPSVVIRQRGPRTLEEIPPGEVRALGDRLAAARQLAAGGDDHLRAVLEFYDLKRLTTQVRVRLCAIFECPAAEAGESSLRLANGRPVLTLTDGRKAEGPPEPEQYRER